MEFRLLSSWAFYRKWWNDIGACAYWISLSPIDACFTFFFDYFNKPRLLSLSRLKEKYRKDVLLFVVDVVDKWIKSWFCFLFYDRYVYKYIHLSTNTQKRAYPIAFLFPFFFSIRLGVDFGTRIVWLKFGRWDLFFFFFFFGQ